MRAARRPRRARGRGRRRPAAGSCSSAAARARAAFQHVLADLAGRPVVVPDAGEHVATGACVQAAAVLHGRAPEPSPRRGSSAAANRVVEPAIGVDRDARSGRRYASGSRAQVASPVDGRYADSILDLVGNTPLVRLQAHLARPKACAARLLAKVETDEPRRQRQGPRRDRDDRRRRARRLVAAGRNDRRADVGQHRRRARDRRRAARLPAASS